MRIVAPIICLLFLGGCSAYLEATRPDPVNLQNFAVGTTNRIDVVGKLGTPMGAVTDGNQNCDVYKLYTTGPGSLGKGAIAAGEVAADVFTLGLAEVVTTPTEAVTRNAQHTVLFCYTPDNKLGEIRDTSSKDNPGAQANSDTK